VCRLGEFLGHQSEARIPEAARYFQAVLASNPSSAPALAGLGFLRYRQQRYDDAYRYLQQAIASGSTDFRVYYYAGRVRWDEFARETHGTEELAKNRALLDEARADFRKSVELNPDFPEANAALGRTYLAEQGPAVDEGIAALEAARKKLPSREDVAADLAALYDRKGDKSRGDAVLKAAGATEASAKRGKQTQLEASLQDVNKLLDEGKDDEALALFDGMIAKSSGRSGPSSSRSGSPWPGPSPETGPSRPTTPRSSSTTSAITRARWRRSRRSPPRARIPTSRRPPARRPPSSPAGSEEGLEALRAPRSPGLSRAIFLSAGCGPMIETFRRKCPFCGGDMLRSRSHKWGYTHYFWQKPWGRTFFGFGAERVYPWACMGCGVVLFYLDRLPAVAEEYRDVGEQRPRAGGRPATIKP
jgi:tetratricopeptide (TPR) repeat protein